MLKNFMYWNLCCYGQDEEGQEQEPGQAQLDNIPQLEENIGPPPHVTHHVTHPDSPNTPNLPGYMKVSN